MRKVVGRRRSHTSMFNCFIKALLYNHLFDYPRPFVLTPEIGWYYKVGGLKIDIEHRRVGGLKNKNRTCEHTEIADHIRKGEQTADHSLRISDEYHTNYPLFVVNPRPLTLDLNLKNMIVTLNLSCRLCLLTFCLYWWGRMTMGGINYELGMTYVR